MLHGKKPDRLGATSDPRGMGARRWVKGLGKGRHMGKRTIKAVPANAMNRDTNMGSPLGSSLPDPDEKSVNALKNRPRSRGGCPRCDRPQRGQPRHHRRHQVTPGQSRQDLPGGPDLRHGKQNAVPQDGQKPAIRLILWR